jgi:hypothetical protein
VQRPSRWRCGPKLGTQKVRGHRGVCSLPRSVCEAGELAGRKSMDAQSPIT